MMVFLISERRTIKLFGAQGQLTESVESSFLIHRDVYHDLSVCS